MVFWETYEEGGADHPDEFARIWKGLDKLVISSTLERASSGNTRIVTKFLPEEIRRLKAESTKDISVAGPTLAAQFIKRGWSMNTGSTTCRWSWALASPCSRISGDG